MKPIAESFKSSATTLLMRAGVYERLKCSRAYDCYWACVDRRILDDRNREVQFYQKTLQGFRDGDLIFDIGANQGYKTDVFLRLGARVVAVDPDETNQQRLMHKFLKYRLTHKPVRIVGKAVSDSRAMATMFVDAAGSPKNTLSSKWVTTLRQDDKRFGERMEFSNTSSVETTTIEDLMEEHGVPFFIKIDVEGHEASALRGMRRGVRYLSFEVNLPEFRSEGAQCIELLSRILMTGEFNFMTDCQTGLALEEWLDYGRFMPVYQQIDDSSVEVFWRTSRR